MAAAATAAAATAAPPPPKPISRRPARCAPRSTSTIRSSRRRTPAPASRAAFRSSSRASLRGGSAWRRVRALLCRRQGRRGARSPARGTSAFSRSIRCAPKKISFTAPYVVIEGAYLVPEGSPIHDNAEVDRPGIRVAVSTGSAYDLFLSRELKHASIVRAPTAKDVVAMFVAQKLDVAAGVRPMLEADVARAFRGCACCRAASWRSTRRWERRAAATPAPPISPTSSRR